MAEVPPRFKTALADRYRIESEISSGGMATVYLAQDLEHDRRVALKDLSRGVQVKYPPSMRPAAAPSDHPDLRMP
jgi:serine/threonine protein kinase